MTDKLLTAARRRKLWRTLRSSFARKTWREIRAWLWRPFEARLAQIETQLQTLQTQVASQPERRREEVDATETLRALGVRVARLSGTLLAPIGEPQAKPAKPARVSVVIPTDTRVEALDNLLNCLRFLDGPEFEVVVVRGPTEAGMSEMLAKWAGSIKLGRNDVRNISISRNLGIAMAAGDIVAFIDDDGLPDADWLSGIVGAFDNPEVGGAGGRVVDHLETQKEYKYLSMDRLGRLKVQWQEAREEFNFPLSFQFPFMPGVNCAFRRDVLLAVGGFDEEFEYWFDESDLCCRVIDAGWLIRQLPEATVHHMLLSSHIRTTNRIMRQMYAPLKGKLYFSLINNRGHFPVGRAITEMRAFVDQHRDRLRDHVRKGELPPSDLDQYERDVERAWTTGLARGLSGRRRPLDPALAQREGRAFLPFRKLTPPLGKRKFLFARRTADDEGILEAAARPIAALGHNVHVVLQGDGPDRMEFEKTIWVHRNLVPQDAVCELARRLRADSLHIYVRTDTADSEWAEELARRLTAETVAVGPAPVDGIYEGLPTDRNWIHYSLSEAARRGEGAAR